MPPLEIEVYREQSKSWIKAGEVKPGDQPGSISDNKPNGTRNVYLFECSPDDSKSTIYRSVFGADFESATEKRTVFFNPSKCEVVEELTKGKSFEMTVRVDRNLQQPTKFRFTHK